jgi:5'-nucleotidase
MEEFTVSRRRFVRQSLLLSAGLSSGLLALPAWAAAGVKITILHTNDTHSRLDPYPQNGPNAGRGGVAARMRLISQIRSNEQYVLLFDAGDIFQGTPYFNFFKGALEMKAMEMMGYDAATMGNHDFDEGIENFNQQLRHVKFPFVVSNYHFDRTVLDGKIKPYTIFEKGGIKIGVFGLGINPEGLIPTDLFGEIVFEDPYIAATRTVDLLRNKERCQLVVCLSHLGFQYKDNKPSDLAVAKQINGIDLIIGGHTHTFLDQPEAINWPNGQGRTLITQVGHSGLKLGRIDVFFDKKCKGFKCTFKQLEVS